MPASLPVDSMMVSGLCQNYRGYVRTKRFGSQGKAEAEVVVAIARRIVVAIGRPQVPAVVVPATAAVHPVRPAYEPFPFLVSKI